MAGSASIGVLLILVAVLTINLHSRVAKQLYESKVRSRLKAELLKYPGAYLADVRFSRAVDGTIVRAIVRGPEPFSAQQVAKMESSLLIPLEHLHSALLVRYVYTTVMSAKGPVYSAEETGAGDHKP